MIVLGLITLALIAMLQSTGALAESLPIEISWSSDVDHEPKRAHAAGRALSCPDVISSAEPSLPWRAESTTDVVEGAPAPPYNVRLRSSESRSPPALLAHSSV